MNLDKLFKFLENLNSVDWRWDKNTLEDILLALNWKMLQKINQRHEYRTPEELIASVYFSDNFCALIEIELDVFIEVETLDDMEYEDKVDEYYEKFENVTEEVARSLGPPVFNDGSAAKGFPEDQDAIWLSLWTRPSARYMIQQKHEGREIPIRICFMIAPPM